MKKFLLMLTALVCAGAMSALTVTPKTLTLNVGETATVSADVATVTWMAISATNSFTISATTGQSITVTAIAAGMGSIVATSGDAMDMCSVTVNGGGGGGTEYNIDAAEIYPIFLDQDVYDANSAKMQSDFRVDDDTKHLYIWASGETYNAGDGSGKNYFGLTNGYMSLTVAAPDGWSGGGVNLDATYATQVNDLIAKIKAEPDKWFYHIGIKSTDNCVHKLYLFGDAQYHIVLGASAFVDNGVSAAPFCDFTRDGSWHGIDFPMSTYASSLPTISGAKDIFSFLSGNSIGSQLNLDACYFYKKADHTGLSEVESTVKAQKFFENGKMYIQRNGVCYDAAGKIVK